ncbi:matrixin, partial [Acidovorax sp. A1169]|nr:matrixin [Acidovorax sp. A1169]
DTKLALDLNGHAGEAAKLLGALGGPALLTNKGVVGEVIRLLDAGATSQTIAGLGLQLLGVNTPTQIAQTLWTNVVGRAGTDGELKLLTDIMAGGVSGSELTVMAANLEMNAVRIDLVGLTAKGIEFA